MRDEARSSGDRNDDRQIIHRKQLCRKFSSGRCFYGERCKFLHDPEMFRESSAIIIKAPGSSVGHRSESNQPEVNGERCKFLPDPEMFRESSARIIKPTGSAMGHRGGSNQPEVNRPVNNTNMKPVYWKTKLCTKWEITGQCPIGERCQFAHGQAELRAVGGRISTTKTGVAPTLNEEIQAKKSLLKKINGIYGDWIEDLP